MKALLGFLVVIMAIPAMAVPSLPQAPYKDASELLAWLKKSRVEMNRAGRAHDLVTLSRIKRDAFRWTDVWYIDAGHRHFLPCSHAARDMGNFLDAYEKKDMRKRDLMGRLFRDDLAECERLVRAH
ncbi:hypothetical protein [Paludibacterium denitrificans]|uniref:Uncharacterized protein n=1 Tax=Paludibacterium denitrificans TaxID=2675226 RepID=A0A844GB14_9NEIS|nr:hypothetical protein [Paludibacterium denitrificans]MTD32428.1 hypothetical protein [Paludibacterium denitrificans]